MQQKSKIDQITILLSGAGTQTFANVVGGLKKDVERNYRIIGVDADKYAYGLYLADKGYVIPMAKDPGFLNTIVSISKNEHAQIFIPLLSKEYNVISSSLDIFRQIGVTVPISSYQTIEVCNDKWLTYKKFIEINIPTPKTVLDIKELEKFKGQYLAKPRRASGSRGLKLFKNIKEVKEYSLNSEEYIIQEFIKGQEFTIDALATNESEPVVISPRLRLGITDGKATKSQIILNKKLINYAEKIIKDLKIVGACNIQGFLTERGCIFTEINPRFAAGGLPLTIAAGANLPKLLIDMALGLNIAKPNIINKMIMLRYMTEVVIEENNLVN